MELGNLVAWIALGVASLTFLRTEHREKLRHVTSVSIFESWATGQIAEDNHSEIIVRNDGTHAIVVSNVGVAYGRMRTFERNKPHGWSVVYLPLERSKALLEPGGKLILASPDPLTGLESIGPVINFVDASGKVWQKTTTSVVQLDKRRWKPRRRDAWFERQRWFARLDQALTRRAIRSSEKHPGRFPYLAFLIDFMWGWRPGHGPEGLQPLNAPLGWRYCVTGWISPPKLDLQPRYEWRDGQRQA